MPRDPPISSHTLHHPPPQFLVLEYSPQLRSDLSHHNVRGLCWGFPSQIHGWFPFTEPPSEDLESLHPGALLFRAAGHPPSLPTMADALAHGADVNWVNGGQENATPLIQATAAVRVLVTSLQHLWSPPLFPLLTLVPALNPLPSP